MQLVLKNTRFLDVRTGNYNKGKDIFISKGKIHKIVPTDSAPIAQGVKVIDCGALYVLPGLIDSHVHTTAITPNFAELEVTSSFYVAVKSAEILQGMLHRGFTTVRDAGGADYGLAQAMAEDPNLGPEILFGGKAISQTGGHGDVRTRGRTQFEGCFCCAGLGTVVDGVSEVRRAARDEIRKGAHHLKIMASGGVASPTDRIDSTQFSLEEIRALVEEAEAANIYCMAHAYTARAIKRLLENGVKTIEHGNLLDEECCDLFVEKGAYLVPTLVTYQALAKEGVQSGLPAEMESKIFEVLEAGMEALKLAHDKGVKMLYGSDLLGLMHRHQLEEFNIRSAVIGNLELIQQATINAAECFNRVGEIGEIIEGGFANIVAYRKDPLQDISVLTKPEDNLNIIMNRGVLVKND